MAMTAEEFQGVLNSNEIYDALFNLRILFQKIAPNTVKKDEVVSLVEKSTGMYGDTGVQQGMDIQGTYDFTIDLEASKLLQNNRNKTQKIEKYTIDEWRQTDVTNDAYISKRAFLDEGTFAMFNGYIVGTLAKAMDAYESGKVKTSLGTYVSPIPACNINVSLPVEDGTEETERKRAALIKLAIMDLKDDMEDNSRKYNGYNFYSSYDFNDFTPVFNSRYVNKINSLALYQAFNPEYLKSASGSRRWTPKWFGKAKTSGNTGSGNKTIYSLIECNSDGSKDFPISESKLKQGVYRIFPGDLLPDNFAYGENEAYEKDEKVICKIFAPEFIYYMTGYQQGESFHNARSGTDNHYLRKGFSKVQVSKFAPFITLVETNPKGK